MALGTDFYGATDLTFSMKEARGRTALGQALIRRLTTPKGQYLDYPDYGFDVSSLIGTTFNESFISSRVRAQCFAEEEVDNAIVTVSQSAETLTIVIRVTDGEGPFDLTISVNPDLQVSYIIPDGS